MAAYSSPQNTGGDYSSPVPSFGTGIIMTGSDEELFKFVNTYWSLEDGEPKFNIKNPPTNAELITQGNLYFSNLNPKKIIII
jgi:hypothetical protein